MLHQSPWPPCQVRVRLRKNPKRKRRLAYARSGLMINFAGSKESEYWSFPLPPFSPRVSTLKTSASSVDVRALKSQVKVQSRGGCCALHDLHVHVPPPKKMDGYNVVGA